MKSNLFKINRMKATALLILSIFFAINVMAQNTSVTITVNPNPIISPLDYPVRECPDAPDYVSHTFTLSDANVTATISAGTFELQYSAYRDNFEVLLPVTQEFTVNAGKDTTFYARALSGEGCLSEVIELRFIVHEFPSLTIEGPTTVCATKTETYTNSEYDPDLLLYMIDSCLWSVQGGTIIGDPKEWEVMVKWDETTTGSQGAITLTYWTSNYDNMDQCKFVFTQPITISPMPTFETEGIATCYNEAIDLMDAISTQDPETGITFEFSTADGEDFEANIIDDDDAYIPTTATTPIYVRAFIGECYTEIQPFTLTMYDEIVPVLGVVVDNETSTDYEECSNNPENEDNTITLKVTVTGGCPDTDEYIITFKDLEEGVVIDDENFEPETMILTITKEEANTGYSFNVTVPADGEAYDVSIIKVMDNCECSMVVPL